MDPLFEFAFAVKAASRELERWTNDAVRELGITGAQADAIAVIGQAGPISLKDLGDLLIAEAGHPSRLVDRLVAAGWVQRAVSDEDRRRVELTLTPAGRRLRKRIDHARERALAAGRELLGDRHVEGVTVFLRSLLEGTPYDELITRRKDLLRGKPV